LSKDERSWFDKLTTNGYLFLRVFNCRINNFPIFDKEPLPPSLRSMDEVNAWIEEDYKLFFNREIYEKEKRLLSVNVPFVLRKDNKDNSAQNAG
jgi:hypothetical protein